MNSADLAKIKKYHIEKEVWGNYAGAYKSDKGKKTKKKTGHKKMSSLFFSALAKNVTKD